MGPGLWLKGKRKGEVAEGASLPGQSWAQVRGPGVGWAVILERPDAECEKGRQLGLGRRQVGFLREVSRRPGIFSSCGLEPEGQEASFLA